MDQITLNQNETATHLKSFKELAAFPPIFEVRENRQDDGDLQ